MLKYRSGAGRSSGFGRDATKTYLPIPCSRVFPSGSSVSFGTLIKTGPKLGVGQSTLHLSHGLAGLRKRVSCSVELYLIVVLKVRLVRWASRIVRGSR